jgi:phosphoserine phosphatase
LLGVPGFHDKVAGLSRINLVQQGAELAYLLRHDPEFRRVRKEHLMEVGRRVRLKKNIHLLAQFLDRQLNGYSFSFYVISAAPREVLLSALAGIVPPDHIFGTQFEYDPSSGEICEIRRVPAGYGKVAVLNELETTLRMRPDHTIYMGDGSSDLYVMQHVNSRDGFTIAVSEAKHIARVARRTVLSDDCLSVIVPILEEILKWDSVQIRELFASYGLTVQEWDKIRTDWLTLHGSDSPGQAAAV